MDSCYLESGIIFLNCSYFYNLKLLEITECYWMFLTLCSKVMDFLSRSDSDDRGEDSPVSG